MKIKYLILGIFGLLLFTCTTQAQDADSVYQKVDTRPTFPGGEKAMWKYVAKNVCFPKAAREMGLEGIVYTSFIVNKDGTTTDHKIVKDIGGDCGQEVLRVLLLMPNWKPGMHNGKVVRVYVTLPVSFEQEDNDGESRKERRRKR